MNKWIKENKILCSHKNNGNPSVCVSYSIIYMCYIEEQKEMANSRQQKTSGLQRDRLSSLESSRTEDGDIKMEERENFKMGACALREGGSHEGERISVTRNLHHRQDQGGAVESSQEK